MKKIIYIFIFSLFIFQASAKEKIIFDVIKYNTLLNFKLFLESPEETLYRPGIQNGSEGISGKAGNGNFTAYKFIDLPTDKWTLKVVFEIPAGIRYSNSGIYSLYSDPRINLDTIPLDQKEYFQEALNKSQLRRQKYGAGPFELDFFSHELQIIAGTDATIPPENHGAAAFYGVDIGEAPGTQQLINPQTLIAGETYEMILINNGLVQKSYIRNINSGQFPILVANFQNLPRSIDPVRGGSPIAILLQGFYNNAQDVKLPIFKRITIDL